MGVVLSGAQKNPEAAGYIQPKTSFKEPAVIQILHQGFSLREIIVEEGQVVTWQWELSNQDTQQRHHNIVQVVLKKDSDNALPVQGGFSSGDTTPSGKYSICFRLQGCYQFISEGFNHSSKALMTVTVLEKPELGRKVQITDNGFEPWFIEVYEGDTVSWFWENCDIPHTLHEKGYCFDHGGLLSIKPCQENGSSNGSYQVTFRDTGLFYFETEVTAVESTFPLCVVKVTQRTREFKAQMTDDSIDVPFISAHVGERLWLDWQQTKGQSFTVEITTSDGQVLVSSKPRGSPRLLSFIFPSTGVYFYGCVQRYLWKGCAVVTPRPVEHVVRVSRGGFRPELGSIKEGERIWWSKENEEEEMAFSILETERCLASVSPYPKRTKPISDCLCQTESLTTSFLKEAGLCTSLYETPGLYTFQLCCEDDYHNPDHNFCSIVVQTKQKHVTIKVSERGFGPNIVNVHPGDQVWWQWQERSGKLHNITQVNHQRGGMEGFSSGTVTNAPFAFTHVFTELGVNYFISDGLPGMFGAVVVTPRAQIHRIHVTGLGLTPDPIVVGVTDCVCWMWSTKEQYTFQEITSPDEIDDKLSTQCELINNRRCLAKTFNKVGAHHFVCTAVSSDEVGNRGSGSFINTVIVDPVSYSQRVSVSSEGFTPPAVTIGTSQSVIWSWEDRKDEAHNIIHIHPPPFTKTFLPVRGVSAFDSGPTTCVSTFFHTFDVPGTYYVMSEGVDRKIGRVNVLAEELLVTQPKLLECKDEGNVECGYTVYLACETESATIQYTVDGRYPTEGCGGILTYNPSQGVTFHEPGLFIIRAVGVMSGWISSGIFTSKRYWVLEYDDTLQQDNEEITEIDSNGFDSTSEEMALKEEIATWQWQSCVPCISVELAYENTVVIDILQAKSADLSWIKGYQVYFNGSPYSQLFSPVCSSLLVGGLLGGKVYHIVIAVFPVHESYSPQLSNEAVITCPPFSSSGGPAVSLETCNRLDAVVITWPAKWQVASESPALVSSYTLYVNGDPFEAEIVPEKEIEYYQVLFESSQEDQDYCACVAVHLQDPGQVLYSNEVQFFLPLTEELLNFPSKELQDSQNENATENEEFDTLKELMIVAERLAPDSPGMPHAGPTETERVSVLSRVGKMKPIPENQLLNTFYPSQSHDAILEDDSRGSEVIQGSISEGTTNQSNSFDSGPGSVGPKQEEARSRYQENVRLVFYAESTFPGMEGISFPGSGNKVLKHGSIPDAQDEPKEDESEAADAEGPAVGTLVRCKGITDIPSHTTSVLDPKDSTDSMQASFGGSDSGSDSNQGENKNVSNTGFGEDRAQGEVELQDQSGANHMSETEEHPLKTSESGLCQQDLEMTSSPFTDPCWAACGLERTEGDSSTMENIFQTDEPGEGRRDDGNTFDKRILKNETLPEKGRLETVHGKNCDDSFAEKVTDGDERTEREEEDVEGQVLKDDVCGIDASMNTENSLAEKKECTFIKPKPSDKETLIDDVGKSSKDKTTSYPNQSRTETNIHPSKNTEPLYLLIEGQPLPRFHVGAWLPFKNRGMDYFLSCSHAFCTPPHIVQAFVGGVIQGAIVKVKAEEESRLKKTENQKIFLIGGNGDVGDDDDDDDNGDDQNYDVDSGKDGVSCVADDGEARGSSGNDEVICLGRTENVSMGHLISESEKQEDVTEDAVEEKVDSNATQEVTNVCTNKPKATVVEDKCVEYKESIENEVCLPEEDRALHELDTDLAAETDTSQRHKAVLSLTGNCCQSSSDVVSQDSEILHSDGSVDSSFVELTENRDSVKPLESTSGNNKPVDISEGSSISQPGKKKRDSTVKNFSKDSRTSVYADDRVFVKRKNTITKSAVKESKRKTEDKKSLAHSKKSKNINQKKAKEHSGTVAQVKQGNRSSSLDKTVHRQDAQELTDSNKDDTVEVWKGSEVPSTEITKSSEVEDFPKPRVVVKSTTKTTVVLEWECDSLPPSVRDMLWYSVLVLGNSFEQCVSSHTSFRYESSPTKHLWPNQTGLEQHCWRTRDTVAEIVGLRQRYSYRIAVMAEAYDNHVRSVSEPMPFTMPGPPRTPHIHVINVKDREVSLSWKAPDTYGDASLVGYKVVRDGQQYGNILKSEAVRVTVGQLQPGEKHKISLIALTSHSVGDSKPSNTITVSCPPAPTPPEIYQKQLHAIPLGCLGFGWKFLEKENAAAEFQQAPRSYCVFVNDKLHGTIPVGSFADVFTEEYVYTVPDCHVNTRYEVSVRSYVEPRAIGDDSQDERCVYTCGCYGNMSNVLELQCAGPPTPPRLWIREINRESVTLSWEKAQEYGHIMVTGYQLHINNMPYGEMLSDKSRETRVTGLSHGRLLKCKIAPLTEGLKCAVLEVATDEGTQSNTGPLYSRTEAHDSGVDSSSSLFRSSPVKQCSCRLGQTLLVHYNGLVQSIKAVSVVRVTCLSAVITWLLEDTAAQTDGLNMVPPESFKVECWSKRESETQLAFKAVTSEMEVKITGLSPNNSYYVTVESRASHANDSDADLGLNDNFINKVKQARLEFCTTDLPVAPSNINILSATQATIRLEWDCIEKLDTLEPVIQVRVFPADKQGSTLHFTLPPETTSFTFEGLVPKTNYRFTFSVATEDHALSSRELTEPQSTSIFETCTNGVDPPGKPWLVSKTQTSLSLEWDPATPYGLSYVQHYLVHYAENKQLRKRSRATQAKDIGGSVLVNCNCYRVELGGLEPGVTYKVVVEAVTGVRNFNYEDDFESEEEDLSSLASSMPSSRGPDLEQELCVSDALLVATAALPEPPVLMVSGVSTSQVYLCWDQPALLKSGMFALLLGRTENRTRLFMEQRHGRGHCRSIHKNRVENFNPCVLFQSNKPVFCFHRRNLRADSQSQEYKGRVRAVLGYHLEVNGRLYARIAPTERTFVLRKCRPGTKYSCVLTILTSPEGFDGKRFVERNTADSDTDEDWLHSVEGYEECASQPLEISLPRQDWLTNITARYDRKAVANQAEMLAHRPDSASSTSNSNPNVTEGAVVLEWVLNDPAAYVNGFNLMWSTCDENEEGCQWIPAGTTCYHLQPLTAKYTYTASLEVLRDDECLSTCGPVHCQVPGPPDEPSIWCRSVTPYQFTIEWNEPRSYGPNTVRAYQVCLNDRNLGNLQSAGQRKATIHCQPNSFYRVTLIALGTEPRFGDSAPSNMLNIVTPQARVFSLAPGDGLSRNTTSPKRPRFDIKTWVVARTNESITISWDNVAGAGDGVKHQIIKWSSVLRPQSKECEVALDENTYTIEKCCPGTNHFIVVAVIDVSEEVLTRSKQLTVQTSAPISLPVIKRSFSLPFGIGLEWRTPTTYGDAEIERLLLRVNSKVSGRQEEETLDPDCQSHVFTSCQPCELFTFQLKAVSTKEGCDSEWSEPLKVTCPGSQSPRLRRACTKSTNCIRVAWDRPSLKGGAKVKSYKVFYLEDNGKSDHPSAESIRTNASTVTHGPLQPCMETDKLTAVNQASFYWVLLELELLPIGCCSVFSEPIRTRPAVSPDPPVIDVEVVGMEERLELEMNICELMQQRDRFLRRAHQLQSSVVVKGIKQKELQIARALSFCLDLECQLESALKAVADYTGSVSAIVRWNRPSDDGDAVAMGYQLLIDGKPFRNMIPIEKLHTNIQVPVTPPNHVITMLTLTGHPVGNSELSNAEHLSGNEFAPFSLFCHFAVHASVSDSRHCAFHESMRYETKQRESGTTLVPVHRGCLNRRIPAPICCVLDVFSGEYKSLVFSVSTKPTALLFWTKWCASSIQVMNFFTQMAENFSNEFSFAACCVRSNEPPVSHRPSLADVILHNGWRGDGKVQHFCACHSHAQQRRSARQGVYEGDVSRLYALDGVPTLVLFNPSGCMAWQGRCACRDSRGFQALICHAFAQVLEQQCLVPGCRQCVMDARESEELQPRFEEESDEERTGLHDYYRQTADEKALHDRLHGTRPKVIVRRQPGSATNNRKPNPPSARRPLAKGALNISSRQLERTGSRVPESDLVMYSTRLKARRDRQTRVTSSARSQDSSSLPFCESTSVIAASSKQRPLRDTQRPPFRTSPKSKPKISVDNLKFF